MASTTPSFIRTIKHHQKHQDRTHKYDAVVVVVKDEEEELAVHARVRVRVRVDIPSLVHHVVSRSMFDRLVNLSIFESRRIVPNPSDA